MTAVYDFSIHIAKILVNFLRKNCYLCNVNRIILHISYLLGHHDCVVVPGLGAFLNHYRQAWIDEETMSFHAPSVSVGYNPEIDYNDWMLADSISRREEISREAAMKIVTEEVKSLRYQLENDREIWLGELGMLRFNGGETPEFIPSATPVENNFAGLTSLSLIDNDAVETAAETEAPASRTLPLLSGFIRVAACFVAIFMVVTFFLHFSSDDESNVHYASIDSGLSAYALADALWGSNPPAAPELYIAARHDEQKAAAEVKHNVETRLNGEDAYLVIVGSFATSEQAAKFMSQHKDIKLGLMEADGNYRVYAASAATLSSAVAAADSELIKGRFAQAWVLKN